MKEWVAAGFVLSLHLIACGGTRAAPPPPRQDIATASSRGEPSEQQPPPREDGRLPDNAKPTGYRLELAVDPSEKGFTGRTRIDLLVPHPTKFVVLHGRNLRIRSARVITDGKTLAAAVRFRAALHSKGEADELVVTVPEALPAGPASLLFDYGAS